MSETIVATGRRKTSVARVMLSEGDGSFEFNGKTLEDYFPSPSMRMTINKPFNICLLYTSPSPRDLSTSRMPSSA